jgi:glycosyltransferase involved in cell wall biosynthesis
VGRALVLHVLPVDLARGAQTYARALRDRLDGDDVAHRTLTLFRSPPAALEPDITLDVPPGPARRAGLDPRAVLRLRGALRRLQPTIVVAHGGEPLKYAAFAGLSGARLAYYKIGVGGTRLTAGKRAAHRWQLSRAGLVAAVSNDAAAEAAALGVPADRLHVVPNGRDPARFTPAAHTHAGPVRLAFVGHLTASKRPERFVDLVRTLRADGVDVRGVMAGDGPLHADLVAAAAGSGVDVFGRVDDVPALLATSDVFVFPSIADGEGMPGVLIEAGLAALPTVTTAVPGAGDVVDDGATGFVVPVDDADALLHAARKLVHDQALRRDFGAAARARCSEHFTLDASIEAWRVLLERTIG